jgi:hypothetical protein
VIADAPPPLAPLSTTAQSVGIIRGKRDAYGTHEDLKAPHESCFMCVKGQVMITRKTPQVLNPKRERERPCFHNQLFLLIILSQ